MLNPQLEGPTAGLGREGLTMGGVALPSDGLQFFKPAQQVAGRRPVLLITEEKCLLGLDPIRVNLPLSGHQVLRPAVGGVQGVPRLRQQDPQLSGGLIRLDLTEGRLPEPRLHEIQPGHRQGQCNGQPGRGVVSLGGVERPEAAQGESGLLDREDQRLAGEEPDVPGVERPACSIRIVAPSQGVADPRMCGVRNRCDKASARA